MVGIDTVTLLLKADQFVILDPAAFTQNANKVLDATPYDLGRGKYLSAVCNPAKKDSLAFGYLPYMTLYKGLRAGGLTAGLRIQFSVPKLIKGNNFDEPDQADFNKACQRLLDGLAHFKIRVWGGIETLKNAPCQVVHYSKNFLLPNLMTSYGAVQEIQKCDVNAWKDISNDRYSNGGYGYKTHSKFHELAFYDKLVEYFNGKKGKPNYDKDVKQLAFDLFNDVDRKQLPEVLRMEVRFGNPKSLKRALEKARLPTDDISFKTIFRQDYSQKVLISHLEDHYTRYPKITSASVKDELELFSDLYVQNPDRQISTIISAVGLYSLTTKAGMRDLKDIVGHKGSEAFLRFARRANGELKYQAEKPEVYEHLMTELKRFRPVHLADFLK